MKKRENTLKNVFAKIILLDGTEVFRDGSGRYRDVHSGKFLKKALVEKMLHSTNSFVSPREAARKGILEAVRKLDKPVETVEQAWERLVEVQTEIALDIDQGSKATTALKFLGSISGLDVVEEDSEPGAVEDLDVETAKLLLAFLENIDLSTSDKK